MCRETITNGPVQEYLRHEPFLFHSHADGWQAILFQTLEGTYTVQLFLTLQALRVSLDLRDGKFVLPQTFSISIISRGSQKIFCVKNTQDVSLKEMLQLFLYCACL